MHSKSFSILAYALLLSVSLSEIMPLSILAQNKTNLPETQKLLQNDNLFPSQSRTQAMQLEAETGHINPQEDAVLSPAKKKSNRVAKKTKAAKKVR